MVQLSQDRTVVFSWSTLLSSHTNIWFHPRQRECITCNISCSSLFQRNSKINNVYSLSDVTMRCTWNLAIENSVRIGHFITSNVLFTKYASQVFRPKLHGFFIFCISAYEFTYSHTIQYIKHIHLCIHITCNIRELHDFCWWLQVCRKICKRYVI